MSSPDPTYIPVGDEGYGVLGIEISLAGAILSFTLFGISLIQFWSVFRKLYATSESDRGSNWTVNFWLLFLLLFTDIADSVVKAIFTITDVRKVILTGMNGILHVPPTAIGVPIADGFVALLVQIIYIRRLVSISQYKGWLVRSVAAFAGLLAFLQFAFSIYTGVVLLQPENEWATKLNAPIVTWLSLSPACDVLLCLAFIWHLRSHMRTSFDSTNFLVTKWIKYTLETGLISTIVQFLTLILWLAMPFSPWYSLPAWVISKIYINSILLLFGTILAGGLKPTTKTFADSGNHSMKQWDHQDAATFAIDHRKMPDSNSVFGGSTLAGASPSSFQTRFERPSRRTQPFAAAAGGGHSQNKSLADGVTVLSTVEQHVELEPIPRRQSRVRAPRLEDYGFAGEATNEEKEDEDEDATTNSGKSAPRLNGYSYRPSEDQSRRSFGSDGGSTFV